MSSLTWTLLTTTGTTEVPTLIFIAGVVCFVLVTQTTEWRYLSDKQKEKRAEKRFWRTRRQEERDREVYEKEDVNEADDIG